jgi:hypothetical protein
VEDSDSGAFQSILARVFAAKLLVSSGTLVALCMPVASSPSLSRAEAVAEAFLRLYDKGLVYRGSYMVNWSPHLQTAVSDLVSADPAVHHSVAAGADYLVARMKNVTGQSKKVLQSLWRKDLALLRLEWPFFRWWTVRQSPFLLIQLFCRPLAPF